jgi:hypothetical protein
VGRKEFRYLTGFGLIVLVAAAPACGAGSRPTETLAIEDQVATAVAQTFEATPSPNIPRSLMPRPIRLNQNPLTWQPIHLNLNPTSQRVRQLSPTR